MKKKWSLLLAFATTFSLAACSSTESNTSSSGSDTENATPSTSTTTTTGEKVTVYMPSPTGLADKIAAGFTESTGIAVEQFQGTTGEILARLETEESNPIADVVILASWSDGLTMKNDDKLQSYTPEGSESVVDGWIDEDSMLFGYSASAAGVIYNTILVPELSADWDELASSEYADMLAIPDPALSGSCKDFLAGYVHNYGWDDFEAMAENGMTIPGANAAALSAVTTGEVGILVAGVDYNAYSSMAKGEPLAVYYPEGGTVVNPRPAMILETAPNVDNAQQFIDYLYSDEVQQMVVDVYLLPALADMEYDNRATLEEISQVDYDWDAMMEISGEVSTKLVELCK